MLVRNKVNKEWQQLLFKKFYFIFLAALKKKTNQKPVAYNTTQHLNKQQMHQK